MIKYRNFIIILLLSFALFIVGIFNVNAMVYSTDVSYYERRETPLGYPNHKSVSLSGSSGSNYMGVITYNFSNQFVVNCETNTCLIVIPYTAMVSQLVSNSSSSYTDSFINDFSFTAQVGGPGYFNVCSSQDNNVECVVPNNTILSSMDLICNTTAIPSSANDSLLFHFQTLGFWLIYNIGQNSQAIQDTADNTKEINDNIKDSSIDTNNSSSSYSIFGSTTNSGMNNTPVSSLIALPITFLQGVNTAISGSCTNVNYIELFDYQLVLPCLNLSDRLGSVWTIIDTIFSCMLIFSIGKSLVKTFARLSDMDTNIMYECYANGREHRGE